MRDLEHAETVARPVWRMRANGWPWFEPARRAKAPVEPRRRRRPPCKPTANEWDARWGRLNAKDGRLKVKNQPRFLFSIQPRLISGLVRSRDSLANGSKERRFRGESGRIGVSQPIRHMQRWVLKNWTGGGLTQSNRSRSKTRGRSIHCLDRLMVTLHSINRAQSHRTTNGQAKRISQTRAQDKTGGYSFPEGQLAVAMLNSAHDPTGQVVHIAGGWLLVPFNRHDLA